VQGDAYATAQAVSDLVGRRMEEYLTQAEQLGDADMALVIDGRCLMYALDPLTLRGTLLKLCMLCKAVVCCRVSPLQKAQVLPLVIFFLAHTASNQRSLRVTRINRSS
jgi:phospholipid-transporting ATPase